MEYTPYIIVMYVTIILIASHFRILVMSDGTVAEFDTPERLLSNKSGIFYGMAKEAGLIQ